MAKLTTKARKSLKSSEFALPKKRKYPIQDKPHAANAKARASQMEKKGVISSSTKKKIDTAANKVLKKKAATKPKKSTTKPKRAPAKRSSARTKTPTGGY